MYDFSMQQDSRRAQMEYRIAMITRDYRSLRPASTRTQLRRWLGRRSAAND